MTGHDTSSHNVGRETKRDTLAELWNAAATGTGGLVLVAGEPGMGKTRLINELSEHVVRPSGGTVLVGGCHDGDVAANAPFVEAFTEWVRGTAPDELARVLGAEAAVVGRMVSVVADALPDTGEPLPVPRDAEIARL